MYLTPAQLADRLKAMEIAQCATPEREAVVDAELMDATLRQTDRSAWAADAIAVADAALAVVQKAIDDANARIDQSLAAAKRYPLPYDGAPNTTAKWACDIVRYLLHTENLASDDRIVRDFKDALKALQLVVDGKLMLGASDPGAAATAQDVRIESAETVFGRANSNAFI